MRRVKYEAGVNLVCGEGVELHVERGLAQLQRDLRVLCAKAAQPRGQRTIGDAGDEGQPHPAGLPGGRGLHLLRQRVGQL